MWWPHEFLICGDLVSSGCHSRDEEAVWALVVIARNSLELSGVKSISTRSLISTRGWGGGALPVSCGQYADFSPCLRTTLSVAMHAPCSLE